MSVRLSARNQPEIRNRCNCHIAGDRRRHGHCLRHGPSVTRGSRTAWASLALVQARSPAIVVSLRDREGGRGLRCVDSHEHPKTRARAGAGDWYQEQRDVGLLLVTAELWPYFYDGTAAPSENTKVGRNAYRVAWAMLDHFEHLRVQDPIGSYSSRGWQPVIRRSLQGQPCAV